MFTYNNDEMNKLSSIIYSRIIDISKVCLHEFRMIFKDEGVLIFVVLVPLLYPLLYSWIYNNEVVHEVPVAVVDNSHSAMSRKFTRAYDATPDVKVAYHCNSIEEAKRLVGRQEVYGILYFPTDFNTKLNRMQQSHISLYCNMGIMLTYKALYQSATAVASDLNAQIQVSVSQNYTSREDEISTRPLDFDEVPIFNNTGGYGNFILPGVLVLILQQVLLLGIGMSMGTSIEEKRLQRISGMLAKPFGLGRIMIGRTLALFGFFTLIGTYVLLAVPKMFNFVHILHGSDFALFLVPYLLACIFFAYTFSFFVRQRENVMLLVVFTSVPFLFMSGVSWPKSNIPEAWSYVSYLIPSTFGIQGFVKMNTMGAVFSDIIPEVKALWIQAIIYFCTACAASRWQIRQCCK